MPSATSAAVSGAPGNIAAGPGLDRRARRGSRPRRARAPATRSTNEPGARRVQDARRGGRRVGAAPAARVVDVASTRSRQRGASSAASATSDSARAVIAFGASLLRVDVRDAQIVDQALRAAWSRPRRGCPWSCCSSMPSTSIRCLRRLEVERQLVAVGRRHLAERDQRRRRERQDVGREVDRAERGAAGSSAMARTYTAHRWRARIAGACHRRRGPWIDAARCTRGAIR